jgi:hypothetical protein
VGWETGPWWAFGFGRWFLDVVGARSVSVFVFVWGWMRVGAAAAEMGQTCGVATSESVSRIERHGRHGLLALGRCLGTWCCLLI